MAARMTSAGPSDSEDDVRPPSSTTHNRGDRIKSRRKAHERPEVGSPPRAAAATANSSRHPAPLPLQHCPTTVY
jgi:hypothetical protein